MNRLFVVATLAVLTAMCGGGTSVSPTSPSASVAPTPSAPVSPIAFTLSGVVFEVTATGTTPVRGVQVEEYDRHTSATTDADGVYRISGVSGGRIFVGFDKEGYQSNRSSVTVNGDTRFDIEAIRR
jgi:hypothetical protein